MKPENKYGTNKTIRFCHGRRLTSFQTYSSEQFSIDKRNRWKLLDLLKDYAQSSDYTNKIVIRRNYNFYQYNGYKTELRENPPRHLSFARRPDFIYQPYANFIKVNQDIFGLALRNGWKVLKYKNNLERLFDISIPNISVTLIYFLDGPKHLYPSDWFNAWKHAFGGYFADYTTVCLGDHCPFGPRIRGQQTSNSRIDQVLFIVGQNNESERYANCSCGRWRRSTKSDRHEYKEGRSKVKMQRREKYKLTIEARRL
jgi:hypothetical protein